MTFRLKTLALISFFVIFGALPNIVTAQVTIHPDDTFNAKDEADFIQYNWTIGNYFQNVTVEILTAKDLYPQNELSKFTDGFMLNLVRYRDTAWTDADMKLALQMTADNLSVCKIAIYQANLITVDLPVGYKAPAKLNFWDWQYLEEEAVEEMPARNGPVIFFVGEGRQMDYAWSYPFDYEKWLQDQAQLDQDGISVVDSGDPREFTPMLNTAWLTNFPEKPASLNPDIKTFHPMTREIQRILFPAMLMIPGVFPNEAACDGFRTSDFMRTL